MSPLRIVILVLVVLGSVLTAVFFVRPSLFRTAPVTRSILTPEAAPSIGEAPVAPTLRPDLTPPPALQPPIAGTLEISTTPAGAAFALYPSASAEATPPITPPVREGTAPATVDDLPPKPYTVFVRLPGWPEERKEVLLNSGERLALDLTFPHGRVEVKSEPDGAQIFHGERWLGKTPLTVDLPLGEQELVARATDRPERKEKVLVEPLVTTAVAFDLRPSGRTTRTRKPKKPDNPFDAISRTVKKVFSPKKEKKSGGR